MPKCPKISQCSDEELTPPPTPQHTLFYCHPVFTGHPSHQLSIQPLSCLTSDLTLGLCLCVGAAPSDGQIAQALTGVGAFTTERLYPYRKDDPKAPTRAATTSDQDQSWEWKRKSHLGAPPYARQSRGNSGGKRPQVGEEGCCRQSFGPGPEVPPCGCLPAELPEDLHPITTGCGHWMWSKSKVKFPAEVDSPSALLPDLVLKKAL